MSKVTKTFKLSETQYKDVADFLDQTAFHAQNVHDSSTKCNDDLSFDAWKKSVLNKYPHTAIEVSQVAHWSKQVTVLSPAFQKAKAEFSTAKSNLVYDGR